MLPALIIKLRFSQNECPKMEKNILNASPNITSLLQILFQMLQMQSYMLYPRLFSVGLMFATHEDKIMRYDIFLSSLITFIGD